MTNPQRMWDLYLLAKTWGARPSELAEIEPGHTSYCFDEAIALWGLYIESELDQIEDDKPANLSRKRLARLHEILEIEEPKAVYADPMSMLGKAGE